MILFLLGIYSCNTFFSRSFFPVFVFVQDLSKGRKLRSFWTYGEKLPHRFLLSDAHRDCCFWKGKSGHRPIGRCEASINKLSIIHRCRFISTLKDHPDITKQNNRINRLFNNDLGMYFWDTSTSCIRTNHRSTMETSPSTSTSRLWRWKVSTWSKALRPHVCLTEFKRFKICYRQQRISMVWCRHVLRLS